MKSPLLSLATLFLLSSCATQHELNIAAPSSQARSLPFNSGSTRLDTDEYYVQLVSEFDYQGDSGMNQGCHEFGSSYVKGAKTSQLVFQVKNDALKFFREVPGFSYQSSSGRCDFSFDAKKVYLSPWMRLDNGKDSHIDYSFITNDSGQMDMSKLGGEVDTASNALAVTGVGMGVAVIGKVASGWMSHHAETGKQSQRHESRSLPPLITYSGNSATLNEQKFPLFDNAANPLNPLPSKPKMLGELKVYPELKPSLLLKTDQNGQPDAKDLSLEELLRLPIQNGADQINLQKFITDAAHPESPNLQPDWNNYKETELNCRKLKVTLRDLGFNKFDRNAVLYYFLDKSQDFKNYNVNAQRLSTNDIRPNTLQQYQAKNFQACLTADDINAMKKIGLQVNNEQDWQSILQPLQEKESYLAAIQSLERQLTAVIKNPNSGEMERQAYPLLAYKQNGQVLLQNNLGNFGLEQILNTASIPNEGLPINSQQLAQLFISLKFNEISCARPVYEQGKLIKNTAIALFTTQAESPIAKGGTLEFEFEGNKINRLAIQTSAFRDFKQDLINRPEVGDCKIDKTWLDRVQ